MKMEKGERGSQKKEEKKLFLQKKIRKNLERKFKKQK